jgi:hypothetical protein
VAGSSTRVTGPELGGRAGSGLALSRGVLLPRNETTILLVEAKRIPNELDLKPFKHLEASNFGDCFGPAVSWAGHER